MAARLAIVALSAVWARPALTTVFFYISGHGFGHAVRQIEIMHALVREAPGAVRIVVRTDGAPWLFERTAPPGIELVPGATDTGVVQIDSLRLDERATIEAAARFYSGAAERVEAERALLARQGARLVVCDAPPLPCAAADAAGIPAFVCSNFTWDWIYREYARDAGGAGDAIRATTQDLYARASGAWRLPLHGGFAAIGNVTDVPLVARHARAGLSRDEVRRALGLPVEANLALISFGGYGVQDLPLDRLDCTGHWHVVLTGRGGDERGLPAGVQRVPEEAMYGRGLRYEDLVRAVDVVISKPGYGIISDCIANDTAVLYTSRGRFPEYEVLVREMPRFLKCRHIGMRDFREGRWEASLDAVAAMPPPAGRPRTDGAQVVARLILETLAARS
jgi:L-arabinokinase